MDPRNIDAYIIGEHGDSEIPVWSSAYVSGMPLSRFCEFRGHHDHKASMEHLAQSVKDSAYEIIKKKKATYYALPWGCAVSAVPSSEMKERASCIRFILMGNLAFREATLSVPAIIGAKGIEKVVPISLSKEEGDALQKSAEILKETAATIGY